MSRSRSRSGSRLGALPRARGGAAAAAQHSLQPQSQCCVLPHARSARSAHSVRSAAAAAPSAGEGGRAAATATTATRHAQCTRAALK
eukprot:scaffold13029_cov113-Isochrysis_galbana.AAC.2